MPIEMTVLITGVGAPGAKGTIYALETGARESGVSLKIVGVDIKKNVAARGFCQTIYAIDGPASPNYCQQLNDICIREKVDVILPQTTREIDWLARNRNAFTPTKIVVAAETSLDISNNKLRTAELFLEIGIPTPQFFRTNSEDSLIRSVILLGYPNRRVVVKLPLSNGMRGLRILNGEPITYEAFANEKPSGVECTLEELLRILHTAERWPELMVCEFLEGLEYSIDCYRGRSGEFAFPRVRNEIRSGISFVTTLVRHNDLMKQCLDAARIIGLDGVFGFQFKESNGVPKLLECNPRVQGTMIASLVTGNNIMWAAVADAVPDLIPPVNLTHPWQGGTCYRYWGATLSDNDSGHPRFTVI
jgi:carbamoyl-phosphate synthase large subunit